MSAASDDIQSAQRKLLNDVLEYRRDAFEEIRAARNIRTESLGASERKDIKNRVASQVTAFLNELQTYKDRFEENEDLERDYWGGVPIANHQLPNGRRVEIVGLDDVIGLPQPIEINVKDSSPGYGTTEVTTTKLYYFPVEIYSTAHFFAGKYMADVGIAPEITAPSEPGDNPVDPGGRFDE